MDWYLHAAAEAVESIVAAVLLPTWVRHLQTSCVDPFPDLVYLGLPADTGEDRNLDGQEVAAAVYCAVVLAAPSAVEESKAAAKNCLQVVVIQMDVGIVG